MLISLNKIQFIKKTITIFLITFSNFSYGSWFNNRMQEYYSCKDSISANQCSSSGCSIAKGKGFKFEYEFKTDVKNQSVFQIFYNLDKQTDSQMHENCKVINSKNWECSTFYDASLIRVTHTMVNGTYVRSFIDGK